MTDGHRLFLIVHPTAGGGGGARALPAVLERLRAGGADVVSETTKSLDHAGELAAQAISEGRAAVAFGGDGLAGRVAGVCAERAGLFAALPGGRGNDFLRGLGVTLEPVAAAGELLTWEPRAVDIGKVTGPDGMSHAFLGIASFGFDSDVQVCANKTRFIKGSSVYTYAALRVLMSWRPARFTVTVAGEREEELVGWSVAAANSPYYGGGMRYAPTAAIDDGQLELVLVERSSKFHFLTVLPKVFSGRHIDDSRVRVRRARKVVVDADRPFQIYADGDPLADLPAEISVEPGQLRLLGPPREAPRSLPGDP